MPYKGGVQLLPETQRRPTLRSYTSGNGYFWFGVILGAIIIVISGIFSSYAANLEDRIAELDGLLQETEEVRNKDQETVLLDVQKQARVMRQLLTSKTYWTQALLQIERMMQSSVRLTRLEASVEEGTISFRAETDSYASVARQVRAFVEGTGIDDVVVNAVTSNPQGGIEFDGELKINVRDLLYKSTEQP